MSRSLALLMILPLSLTMACTKTKSTAAASAETTSSAVSAEYDQEMLDKGYKFAVVKATGNDSCPYGLSIEALNYLLDPTNLKEEFSRDGLKVWVKYRAMRMQARCNEASTPVEITDMSLQP